MGDQILDKRLDKIGGKGLFIKELESALMNNTIDFARKLRRILKDIPTETPEELTIAAVSKREDPEMSCYIDGKTLDKL